MTETDREWVARVRHAPIVGAAVREPERLTADFTPAA